MKETKKEIGETLKVYPTETAIWKGLKSPHIQRNISDFMWKLLHGRLKIGMFWKQIPKYEERAHCKKCGHIETMDHILFVCEKEGREEIWNETEKLWNETTPEAEKNEWVHPSTMLIRGLGGIKKAGVFESKEITEKYVKLVLETVWILWKLRNEMVIGEKKIDGRQMRERWRKEINHIIETTYARALKQKSKDKRMKEIEKINGQWGKIIEKGKGKIEVKEWKG